jgi:predicted short-subunit dehydrogenase-like oxidoreductase (DUF2520 family)
VAARVKPSLYVLGWGRAGSALGLQARSAGYALAGGWSPKAHRRRASVRLRHGPLSARIDADLVALAVPESAMPALARALLGRLAPRAVVFHLAGSAGLSPLRPLADAGFAVGSLHPFCSIADAGTSLRGAACAIDGSPRARLELRRLALALGLRPLARAPQDRPRYHLSAALLVAASLAAARRSERLLLSSGLSPTEARRALAGLLRSIADNLERLGAAGALTGPLARGDRRLLRAHLALLDGDLPARRLYRAAAELVTAPRSPGTR